MNKLQETTELILNQNLDNVDSITISFNDKEGKSLKVYTIFKDGEYEV